MKLSLDQALQFPRDLGFDFETTGLNWIKDRLLSLGLGTDTVSGYIDLRNYDKNTLTSFFKDFFKNHRVILQNAKFDFHFLTRYLSIDEISNIVFTDTMLISQIIDENTFHSLDRMTEYFMSGDQLVHKRAVDIYKKEHKLKDYSQIPFELVANRGEEDAVNTYKLYKILKPKLIEKRVYELEKKLLPVILRVEHNGALVDKDYLIDLRLEIDSLIHEVSRKYLDLNLGSSPQVGKYLFETLKLKPTAFTPKKQVPKTDDASLSLINHPAAFDVLEYRTLVHTKSTYVEAFLEKMDADNVLHCNFKQMGARTGRMSCVNPNLQQIPKRGRLGQWVKSAFIGNITTFDYSQMEAVLYAYLNNDTKMIEAIVSNRDLYSYLAETLYAKKKISKEEREMGKVIFLGRIYGMGDKKFRLQSKGMDPKNTAVFFGNLKKMQDKVVWDVNKYGYVETILGRKRHLDYESAYKGLNAIIQGSAADILKQAMVNLPVTIQDKIMTQVHDELVFHNLEPKETGIIQEVMCDFSPFKLKVEQGTGLNWWLACQDKDNKGGQK